jgi:hypothetical protein
MSLLDLHASDFTTYNIGDEKNLPDLRCPPGRTCAIKDYTSYFGFNNELQAGFASRHPGAHVVLRREAAGSLSSHNALVKSIGRQVKVDFQVSETTNYGCHISVRGRSDVT